MLVVPKDCGPFNQLGVGHANVSVTGFAPQGLHVMVSRIWVLKLYTLIELPGGAEVSK